MPTVHIQTSPNNVPHHSSDCVANDGQHLLQAVWWVSRHWVERLAVDAPPREKLIYLGILADDLVRAGDYSSTAMSTVRTLLCTHCRCLEAARGGCSGQSLDQCPLLNEPRT